MVKLNAGNVLLKPSHRRQLMSWLKRAHRLGGQMGDFILTISLAKSGRQMEVRADVHDAAGDFTCRVRRPEWREAFRELVHMLATRLVAQRQSLLSA